MQGVLEDKNRMKKGLEDIKKTDWDEYYSKPKSWFSSFTQKFTIKYLLEVLRSVSFLKGTSILECGGGNSCFVDSFSEYLSPSVYDVADNCQIAIELLKGKGLVRDVFCINLTQPADIPEKNYDLVFSVGLVEHYHDVERQIIIENHFRFCKPNGLVLITAPTPTKKYLFVRKLMELVHMWKFWDETPIPLDELIELIKPYGEVLHCSINKSLPLTQAVVVCRKGYTDCL